MSHAASNKYLHNVSTHVYSASGVALFSLRTTAVL